MQSETGFPSSHQLKSYVASKSRLKLAARAVLSADAGLLVPNDMQKLLLPAVMLKPNSVTLSWSQTCPRLVGPLFEQDSVMEFGLDQLQWVCSNLVADRFTTGLSQIPLRYPGRRLATSWNLAYHALSSSLAAS